MFTRLGTSILIQKRYRLTACNAVATSFLVVGAGYKSSSFCEAFAAKRWSDDDEAPPPPVLIIPTLNAVLRATRLVRTVALMVVDYELDKMTRSLPFGGPLEKKQSDRLETRREDCERSLHAAQKLYTDKLPDETSRLSKSVRHAIKKEQKRSMEQTAAALAAVEEELMIVDGLSGKSRIHQKAAERLLRLCHENGGLYIKVGQHLANLDYLIPGEYIDVLSTLFDEAPRSSLADVHQVISEDLGGSVEEFFDNFEQEPIASASLAQVHVAYDKTTGKKLAVKVQHAGLRETSRGDMYALTSMVSLVDAMFDEFTFSWISDEIAPHLPKELDFTREGRNAEKAAEHLSKSGLDCVVPLVDWSKTSSRVLTMDYEEGFKPTDVKAMEKSGLNKRDVATLISSVFNSQVFLSAWVHCDPHPANILLRNRNGKPQMVLIDHGLYKAIDDDFRTTYARLWRSLMLADLGGIEQACRNMGVGEAYPLFAAMLTSRPFDEVIERSKSGAFSTSTTSPQSQADKAMIRGYAKQFFKDIVVLLGVLPRQMLLLLKMNDCLRHIDFSLGSPTNTLMVAGNYASRAICDEECKQAGRSIVPRISAWYRHWKVCCRLQLYNIWMWMARIEPSNKKLGFV